MFFDGIFTEPRLQHPEGVAIGPDGSVWCGSENGEVLRIAPDGSRAEEMGEGGGFTLGLAFDGDRALFACDQKQRRGLAARPASRAGRALHGAGHPHPELSGGRCRPRLPLRLRQPSPSRGPGVWALRPRDRRGRALVRRADALRQRHGAGARRRRALRLRDLRPRGQPHRHRRGRPAGAAAPFVTGIAGPARRHRLRRCGRSIRRLLRAVAHPARRAATADGRDLRRGSDRAPLLPIRPTSPSTGRCSTPPISAAGTSPRSTPTPRARRSGERVAAAAPDMIHSAASPGIIRAATGRWPPRPAQAAAAATSRSSWAAAACGTSSRSPIAELAARYDLLVLDHPISARRSPPTACAPSRPLFSADEIAAWSARDASARRSAATTGTAGTRRCRRRRRPRSMALPPRPLARLTPPRATGDDVLAPRPQPPRRWRCSVAGAACDLLLLLDLPSSLGEEPGGEAWSATPTATRRSLDPRRRSRATAPAGTRRRINPIALSTRCRPATRSPTCRSSSAT